MSKNVAYMKNQMEALERLYEKEKVRSLRLIRVFGIDPLMALSM